MSQDEETSESDNHEREGSEDTGDTVTVFGEEDEKQKKKKRFTG